MSDRAGRFGRAATALVIACLLVSVAAPATVAGGSEVGTVAALGRRFGTG